VNFITSHDGFTLQDMVSFTVKRNFANGEENRDGHGENYSDNLGVEGPSDDPVILAARDLRKRNLLATLLLSQGVPMLLGGDELGQTQAGNNNAYAQDNETSWINWQNPDPGLADFVASLTALRKIHPVLRQRRFLHARARPTDDLLDVIWRRADGTEPHAQDWHDPAFRCVCVELRMASEGRAGPDAVFLVFNTGPAQTLTLPKTAPGWRLVLDTTKLGLIPAPSKPIIDLPAQSVLVFTPIPATTGGPK
jgi:isoamylase